MKKADLHVHSKYSNHPSFWFLQRLGTGESYTEPEFIYQRAIKKGMDYVAITDHNRIKGALELKEKFPGKVIVGVETTTYFPDDGCKIHVLIYNIDENEFKIIQNIRENIYELRDFLKKSKLPHSVAHATYSVNNKLTLDHIEKLVLLFDIFEGINGGRNRNNNQKRMEYLKQLTPEHVQKLYEKHRIEPFSDTPWIKGFTGGSDDHAGLFIGETYTIAEGNTISDFLNYIMKKNSTPNGRHNNYQSLAFTIYKIATDFIQNSSKNIPDSFINILNRKLFEQNNSSFKDKIETLKLRFVKRKKRSYGKLIETLDKIEEKPALSHDQKFDMIYDSLSEILDNIISSFIEKISELEKQNNLDEFLNRISSLLPGLFLSVPFFTSLKYTYNSHNLVNQLDRQFGGPIQLKDKKVLWFTDTLYDLNGVSVTLQKISEIASNTNLNIYIVTTGGEEDSNLTNVFNLPVVNEFPLPYYEKYSVKIPSILQSLKIVDEFNPDSIIISTPSTTGLLGMLIGNLMNIKTTAIYHTDFKNQCNFITGDDSLANTLDSYINWFYSRVNEIRTPTEEYKKLLIGRGLDEEKIKIFRRGIDSDLFSPEKANRNILIEKYGLIDGINLVYTGRISKDKNLDFLVKVYLETNKVHEKINLIMVGDGPYYNELSAKLKNYEGIIFAGRQARNKLPEIYASSDLLVFPSTTDTFGMTVLEAQSCGLPAIVSNVGGPQELVRDGKSGFILSAENIDPWVNTIKALVPEIKNNSSYYTKLKEQSRSIVLNSYNWTEVLQDLILDDHENKNSEKKSYTMAVQ